MLLDKHYLYDMALFQFADFDPFREKELPVSNLNQDVTLIYESIEFTYM